MPTVHSVLMMLAVTPALLLTAPTAMPTQPTPPSPASAAAPGPRVAIAAALDDFHDAAAKADGARYFAHFSARGVFLGTDATERWTLGEFRAFADPYFAQGRGWTYTPRAGRRNIDVHERTAWFDEILDNASYGECRGTGVLILEEGRWKIAQYHLTVPVPNDLMKEVVQRIREHNTQPPPR